MKYIKLTKGKVAIVDDEDSEKVSNYSWQAKSPQRGLSWYACSREKGKRIDKRKHISMHRLILNFPNGTEIDHINGNGLDNRKENLRICTHSQNCKNHNRNTNNTSGYKGVSFDKENNKWRVQIWNNWKKIDGGRFNDIKEAALKYNLLAKQNFGEFARLNTIYI